VRALIYIYYYYHHHNTICQFFQAWCLYLARLLQGAAVSIGFVVSPAYIGEMASNQIRGKMCLLVQLSYALGLLFSYVGGWLLNGYAALIIASTCVTVAFAVLLLWLPESPYYLMLDGRPKDAAECLWSLRSYAADDLQSELVDVQKSLMNTRYLYIRMCRLHAHTVVAPGSVSIFLFSSTGVCNFSRKWPK
jgi:MFS family permease